MQIWPSLLELVHTPIHNLIFITQHIRLKKNVIIFEELPSVLELKFAFHKFAFIWLLDNILTS